MASERCRLLVIYGQEPLPVTMGTKGWLEQDGMQMGRGWGGGGRAWNSRHRGMRVSGQGFSKVGDEAYLWPGDNDKGPLMREKRLMFHNCRSSPLRGYEGMSPEVRLC